jgi:hypothetical protein
MLVLAPCLSVSVRSDEGRFALGLVAGNPAGFSAAYDFRPPAGGPRSGAWKPGVQGSVAWDLVSPGGFVVTADALLNIDGPLRFAQAGLPLYAGLGGKATVLAGAGRYGTEDEAYGLSIRLPLGLRWNFGDPSLQAFIEAVPGLLLFPAFAWDAGAGIGLRWIPGRK